MIANATNYSKPSLKPTGYTKASPSETGYSSSVGGDIFFLVLQNGDKLGLAAEKAVLKYEKERVGPDLEEYIEHISIKNVSAGYDIKSITQIGLNKLEPRYIEVKAVSPTLYKFFWTSNEMRVAEILRKTYYLYLLPVAGNLIFSLIDIKIIPDPFSEIILLSNSWEIETNVVCCTLTSE